MNISSKIYVAGGSGMVGSAIIRKLKSLGYTNVFTSSSDDLDLTQQNAVFDFFNKEKPEYVFLAAAKVGGIVANSKLKADFIYDNLMIQTNIIGASQWNKVKKLLFLGSSCIYPKNCPQPIQEDYLLTGSLEPTNDAYAIAKIAGIKMCQAYREQYGCDYISVMPCNLYGPGDRYHWEYSHVIPRLMMSSYFAKTQNISVMTAFGTGSPFREFLHVDDLAEACVFLMNSYSSERPINVGSGKEIQIRELVKLINEISGFTGHVYYDESKPDGTPRKLLDSSAISALGWQPSISLENGLRDVFNEMKTKWDATVEVD